MCDASNTLSSSILIWTLPFIPSNIFPYIALAVVTFSLLVDKAHYNRPSARLGRLDNSITIVGDTLIRAKIKCTRERFALAESETRLLRAKLWTSKIHTHVLEMHDMSWTLYLRNIPSMCKSLAICERELRELENSILLLIEAAHQHKLAQDINESREVVDGVFPGCACPARVHCGTSGSECEV
ncbi:hypothetical protein MVEN_00118900 [Mycena venus]|uniref:Uncharacterized protein n=1 Tax=Mycena venus TaxID=2733690 RepID=A0A8H6Z584_9AGAR|nr:hypothetical protein MVEN_00118900 [Mycena venus]